MRNKNWVYPTVNVLLYALGFPVLFIISLVKSIEWNSYGMYGASSFAPLIAVIILWVLTTAIHCAIYFSCKKRGKTGKSLVIKMLVVPIVLIIGLMGIIDIAMPPLLKDATSNTIHYEDVVYDAQGMHEKLLMRVEDFKKKNNLDASVKFEDEKFQSIFKPLFASMDNAYHAFDPLAIEIALDQPDLLEAITSGKFPINLAATLLLKTDFGNDNNHNLTISELIQKNIIVIIGAVSPLIESGNFDSATINEAINKVLVYKEFDGIKWNIFNILGSNMLFPEIDPNAHIIKSTNDYITDDDIDMGASLGYQDMSWLNGLTDMFFIPLMSIRSLLYAFAAVLAILLAMQYAVAQLRSEKTGKTFSWFMFGKESQTDATAADANFDEARSDVVIPDVISSNDGSGN